MKKKVVVSTHTISLQEQLLQKDLPFLRSVMPQEFSAVLVKGRSNYISLRRLDAAVARADMTFQRPDEFDQLSHAPALGRKDARRQPLGPRLQAAPIGLGRRRQRERQLPGQEMSPPQRVLLLQRPAADLVGQHPGRQPRAVHERPRRPLRRRGRHLAEVRRRDLRRGAHARGRRRRASRAQGHERAVRVHAEPARQRTDRQGPARLSSPGRCDRPGASGSATRRATSSKGSRTCGTQQGGSNGRLRKPLGWPDTPGRRAEKTGDGDRRRARARSRPTSRGSS